MLCGIFQLKTCALGVFNTRGRVTANKARTLLLPTPMGDHSDTRVRGALKKTP